MLIIIGMSRRDHGQGRMSRRELLVRMAAAGVCVPLGFPWGRLEALGADTHSRKQGVLLPPAAGPAGLSESDDALLQEVEGANFRYFWEEANPETGMVRDRCHAKVPDTSDLGSIAATGFGLTALCTFFAAGTLDSRAGRDPLVRHSALSRPA